MYFKRDRLRIRRTEKYRESETKEKNKTERQIDRKTKGQKCMMA